MPQLLNYDCVLRTVEFTNIGYVKAAIFTIGRHLTIQDKKQIYRHRMDTTKAIKELTDETSQLMWLMSETKTLLSGSRAIDYFTPGSCTYGSDWDFYCHHSRSSLLVFVYIMAVHFKVEWENEKDNKDPDAIELENMSLHENAIYYNPQYFKFNVINGIIKTKKRICKINVISNLRGSKSKDSPIDAIMKFHSSVAQCFISSNRAVSLYHNITKDNLVVYWSSNSASHEVGIVKYKNRGFKFISYEEYTNKFPMQRLSEHINARYRTSGDSNSIDIQTGHYTPTHICEKPMTYRLSELVSWYELPNKTVHLRRCKEYLYDALNAKDEISKKNFPEERGCTMCRRNYRLNVFWEVIAEDIKTNNIDKMQKHELDFDSELYEYPSAMKDEWIEDFCDRANIKCLKGKRLEER